MTFEPRISVTIMYASWVDWRKENAFEIADQLEGASEISAVRCHGSVDDGNIWTDARECWLDGVDSDSTHHLVLQGDVELCEGFAEAAGNAIAAVPNRNICFYGSKKAIETAAEAGKRWIRFGGGFWGQAPCIPSVDVAEMVEFGDYYFEDSFAHDDSRLSAWNQMDRSTATWIPIPQLVQHLGDNRSTMGHNMPNDMTASAYVGDYDVDATAIDWTPGGDVLYKSGKDHFKRWKDSFRLDRLVEDGYVKQVDK